MTAPVKNILCISVMENIGGGEEFLTSLCGNLSAYNFIITSPPGKALDLYKSNNIRAITVKSLKKFYRSNSGWKFITNLRIFFNLIISIPILIYIIKSENIDLIIANGNFSAMYSLIPKIITKIKSITIQHLIYPQKSFEGRLVSFLYKFSDKYICVSYTVAENIKHFIYPEQVDKIKIIYNGINLPVLEEPSIRSNEIRIGVIGSIIRAKGIVVIIDALKDILLKDESAKLYIYGDISSDPDSSEYKLELLKKIKENDIINKVIFMGYVDSKNLIYGNLDIVINFSAIPESFSFTTIEAMAYGKVIIAADTGGPAEIINNKYNGFLVEAGNSLLLKETVCYCIDNFHSAEFNEIRNNARKTIEDKYSFINFTSRYADLFNQLTAANP